MANTQNKKKKLSNDEYVKLCDNVNKEIENIYQALKGLNTTLNSLMKGDGEDPYWNGPQALRYFNSAKSNMDNNIKAYNEACQAWNKLYNRYITLSQKGYFGK